MELSKHKGTTKILAGKKSEPDINQYRKRQGAKHFGKVLENRKQKTERRDIFRTTF